MIRFAWLQSRTQMLVAAGAFAVLAIAAAITGVQISHLYTSLVAHCQSGCDFATIQFLDHDQALQQALDQLARVAPALVGIFWRAPLIARELETGTYKLAWTQSVTRTRWLVTKLGLVGLGTVTIAGLLTLAITWWYRAIDHASVNQYGVFDRRGVAPIAYAAFAFGLGAFVGVVVRRTLPAMATTLGIFAAVRVAVGLWVRPHLLTPITTAMSALSADRFGFQSYNGSSLQLVIRGAGPANSWTLSSQMVDSSGHIASVAQMSAFLHQYCPTIGPPPSGPAPGNTVARLGDPARFEACRAQAAKLFHLLVTYQPAGRYWALQWLEAGLFFALALLALGACYWWITRRTK